MHDFSAALTCPLVRRSQIEIIEKRCMTNLFLSTVSSRLPFFLKFLRHQLLALCNMQTTACQKPFRRPPIFYFHIFPPIPSLCVSLHTRFPPFPPPSPPPPRRHTRAFSTPLLHFRFLHARNPPLNRRTSLPSPPPPLPFSEDIWPNRCPLYIACVRTPTSAILVATLCNISDGVLPSLFLSLPPPSPFTLLLVASATSVHPCRPRPLRPFAHSPFLLLPYTHYVPTNTPPLCRTASLCLHKNTWINGMYLHSLGVQHTSS